MIEDVLAALERFLISKTFHSQITLLSHLRGTYTILDSWGCEKYVCFAGLCHSIYGTESLTKAPATLDNREYVRSLIGKEAERLAYLFGAHRKEHFWTNLNRSENFTVEDRFSNELIAISEQDLRDLITLTLANWLEQRPRMSPEFHFLRQSEFLNSKKFLPQPAYRDFAIEYGLAET